VFICISFTESHPHLSVTHLATLGVTPVRAVAALCLCVTQRYNTTHRRTTERSKFRSQKYFLTLLDGGMWFDIRVVSR